MEKHRYFAKSGTRISDKDAEILGERFAVLAQKGLLHPDEVVADAALSASPIHEYFEWNDQEAALQYRLHEARYYLRSIEIEIVRDDEELRLRAFHSIRLAKESNGPDKGYAALTVIIEREDWLGQIIEKALRELIGWQNRYKDYSQLAEPLAEVMAGPVQAAIELLSNGVT